MPHYEILYESTYMIISRVNGTQNLSRPCALGDDPGLSPYYVSTGNCMSGANRRKHTRYVWDLTGTTTTP